MERDLTVNGVRLHCVVVGEGPLVLLLHGFPETPPTSRRSSERSTPWAPRFQRGGPRRIPSRVPAGRIKAPTLLIWGSTTSPSVSSSPMAWTCLREQAAHRVRARYGPLGDGGTARGSEPAAAELPRLASGPVTRDAQRVFQREAPEVERAADDHAAQSAMPELRERRDVLQRADAA